MPTSALRLQNFGSDDGSNLSTKNIAFYLDGWDADCEYRKHTKSTRDTNRIVIKNLIWFLDDRKHETCGIAEIRQFLIYLQSGHLEPRGRWGKPELNTAPSSSTSLTYFGRLKTFFGWIVDEGILDVSPMARLKPPVHRPDQLNPFSKTQVEALIAHAKTTDHPTRNAAIVWLLFDTQVRVSELSGLRVKDVDLQARKITVLGKGQKERSIYFGKKASRALWKYMGTLYVEDANSYVFQGIDSHKGKQLKRGGIHEIIKNLGIAANITGVRCSPHTLRHAGSIEFLRAGGKIEQLKERLGHTSLQMTLKYLNFAEADLVGQRQFSPGDQLKD